MNVNFQSAKEALLAIDAVILEARTAVRTGDEATSSLEAIEKIVRQKPLTSNADPSPVQPRKGQKSKKKKKKKNTFAQRIAERKAKTKCKECGLKGLCTGDTPCKGSSET